MAGGRGPKSKGANWEREVCRRLSRWVTHGKREDVFWRSSMSGGRATVYRKKGRKSADSAAGDICALLPEGRPLLETFFIECKATKDIMLEAYLFDAAVGKRADHWDKPKSQAAAHGLLPLVVLKRNGLPPIVYVSAEGVERLRTLSPRPLCPRAVFPRVGITVYTLEHVLAACNPERLK